MIIAGYVVYSDAALRSVLAVLGLAGRGMLQASAVRRFVLSGVALSKLRRKGEGVKGKMRVNCKELLHKIFRENGLEKSYFYDQKSPQTVESSI